MSTGYVLDACALIAFLNDEEGADKLEALLGNGIGASSDILLHEINLLEIYYGVFHHGGEELAEQTYTRIKNLPLRVVRGLRLNVFKEAGRLKAIYRISLADSIALAEAKSRQLPLVTCDHHEFDIIDQKKELSFYWIR
ncbi:MAG: PIN domain-containing protein [Desulfoferrobacter sp.]